MARGDLETEVHEDLGIFEPLHSELDDIRYGFNTAIAEETKSQKMKTELISNVSHDLKTPLTSLISYIDLMKQEPDEAKRQEYLAVLERNSMRLKHLIEDLFEVSKANSGDLKLNVVDVDLVSLISQTLFELAPAIEKAGLTIKTSYSHDKIVLPLDSQKTYRIVENLVSNVTKYSLRGSRCLSDVDRAGRGSGAVDPQYFPDGDRLRSERFSRTLCARGQIAQLGRLWAGPGDCQGLRGEPARALYDSDGRRFL